MLHSFVQEDSNLFLAEWTEPMFTSLCISLLVFWIPLHFNVTKMSRNIPGIVAPKENKNLKTGWGTVHCHLKIHLSMVIIIHRSLNCLVAACCRHKDNTLVQHCLGKI